ncbi:SDR family oxidoreductase [Actinomadura spongiicola]|uniref:SDR family oxidoreductase n=1 Tax=Actinomadura spongiicola TaxID=2303421 RepID=A0A372G9Q3_9ACTN|nr:SDR family oxidoreductase [Actinomadura spongiicola]RFS82090.1 SDR family oxidoreductase [Actinomadura spongiicola]
MNPTALITGASRGIGAATAARLGRRGYHVIVNYHRNESAARAVVADIESAGGTAEAVRADVRDPAEVADLIATGTRIDLLVCNANIAPTFAPPSAMSWTDFSDKVIGELAAVFHITQRALELMREQRSGQIVYVSSVLANTIMPGALSQATAKAALNTFARQVAAEAGRHGITVNTVAPGLVNTEATRAIRDSERDTFIAENSVLGRITEPDDVAALIVTLTDEGFRAVSGAHIFVDGGHQLIKA